MIDFAYQAQEAAAGAKPGESHSEQSRILKLGWEGCYHERNPALLKNCRLERSHILKSGWEGWDCERNPVLLKNCQPVLKLGYQELMAFLAPLEHRPFAGSPAPLVHAQQVLALRL